MLEAALASLRQILTPPFRSVLYKSLGLTLLLLALAWAGLDKLALSVAVVDHPLLRTILAFATGAGLVVVLAFLIGPISILVAGFFVDDLAAHVEREIYPAGRVGKPVPPLDALMMTLSLSLVSAVVNLMALLLLFVPGVNAVAFLLANAYLFGGVLRARRDALSLAGGGGRSAPAQQRQDFFRGTVHRRLCHDAGAQSADALFGTAFMVRVHKMLSPDPR